MRISELSTASAVPVPTLKFYLREGLLQQGDAIAANRASYGDAHLRRLRLIRALTDIGGLSLKSVKAVVDAIEDEELPLHELLGVAQYALEREPATALDPPDPTVESLLRDVGWSVAANAPARRALAKALATLRDLGRDVSPATLRRYAVAAESLAAVEVAAVPANRSRAEAVEAVVVGTVVYESVLTALRRLAHEHHSGRRFERRPARAPRRHRIGAYGTGSGSGA